MSRKPRDSIAKLGTEPWLHHANQAERSFSRGFFNPQYASNFPCAVVRNGNHIVAFAVLRPSVDKEELALDIVRYDGVAPPGIFAFMVAEIILQGQPPLWARCLRGHKRQFSWFNLGMVPGVAAEAHELGPLRERLGALPYPQSDHFQDLDSYRCFAKRLAPVWRAKYLVLPGGLDTSRILGDIASLIARVET
ncbi:MAG: phosphatidylglycerol lysyltransferase domain-containing protein [Actinomycetota bacterium]